MKVNFFCIHIVFFVWQLLDFRHFKPKPPSSMIAWLRKLCSYIWLFNNSWFSYTSPDWIFICRISGKDYHVVVSIIVVIRSSNDWIGVTRPLKSVILSFIQVTGTLEMWESKFLGWQANLNKKTSYQIPQISHFKFYSGYRHSRNVRIRIPWIAGKSI